MKCPKCGYNSFEYYDNCKKCSNDLTGYKQTYSITSIVLPLEAKEKMAAEFHSTENVDEAGTDASESHDDIFSFDLSDDTPAAPVVRSDDPFNFDEPAAPVLSALSAQPEEDAFASLLETSSQAAESPFGETSAPVTAASAQTADLSSGPGEFDLENFSWDDTPAATAAPGSTEPADDFDSLFGDTKENPVQ